MLLGYDGLQTEGERMGERDMLDALKALRSAGAGLPILGLALTHAWILAPFLSGSFFYICFHAGFGCTLLACAALYAKRPQGSRLAGAMPWLAATLMCLGTAAVFISGSRENLEGVCGVAGGIGSAYCFVRWFEVFCRFTPKIAVDATLLAFALSACVRLLLVVCQALVPSVLLGVLALLPFCSAGALTVCRCSKHAGVAATDNASTERGPVGGAAAGSGRLESPALSPLSRDAIPGGLLPIACELLAYGLVFGVLRNGISEWYLAAPSMLLGHCLRIVLPLLLFWWLQARSTREGASPTLRVAALAVPVALLAIVFLAGLAQSAVSAIVLAARSFVSVLIYVRLFDVVHRAGGHPCAVYGTGRALYEAGLVCGLLTYNALLAHMETAAIPLNVTYFLVSSVLLVMLGSFMSTMRLPMFQVEQQAMVDPPVQTLTLDEACERLARQRDLSEREHEVMRLTCLGYTKRRAAEMLCLSEDTVRYHTKSLYRKLGVHSRQDLLDLLGIK